MGTTYSTSATTTSTSATTTSTNSSRGGHRFHLDLARQYLGPGDGDDGSDSDSDSDSDGDGDSEGDDDALFDRDLELTKMTKLSTATMEVMYPASLYGTLCDDLPEAKWFTPSASYAVRAAHLESLSKTGKPLLVSLKEQAKLSMPDFVDNVIVYKAVVDAVLLWARDTRTPGGEGAAGGSGARTEEDVGFGDDGSSSGETEIARFVAEGVQRARAANLRYATKHRGTLEQDVFLREFPLPDGSMGCLLLLLADFERVLYDSFWVWLRLFKENLTLQERYVLSMAVFQVPPPPPMLPGDRMFDGEEEFPMPIYDRKSILRRLKPRPEPFRAREFLRPTRPITSIMNKTKRREMFEDTWEKTHERRIADRAAHRVPESAPMAGAGAGAGAGADTDSPFFPASPPTVPPWSPPLTAAPPTLVERARKAHEVVFAAADDPALVRPIQTAIMFENGPAHVRAVQHKCAGITVVQVPDSGDVIPVVPFDSEGFAPVMAMLRAEGNNIIGMVRASAAGANFPGDRYDPGSGMTEAHVRQCLDWDAREKRKGAHARAAIFDWDRTLTKTEGIMVHWDATLPSLLSESNARKIMGFLPDQVAYMFGGRGRLKMMQDMMRTLHSNGTYIYVLSNNTACNSPHMNALINTFFQDVPYTLLCSYAGNGGNKGGALQDQPELRTLCAAKSPKQRLDEVGKVKPSSSPRHVFTAAIFVHNSADHIRSVQRNCPQIVCVKVADGGPTVPPMPFVAPELTELSEVLHRGGNDIMAKFVLLNSQDADRFDPLSGMTPEQVDMCTRWNNEAAMERKRRAAIFGWNRTLTKFAGFIQTYKHADMMATSNADAVEGALDRLPKQVEYLFGGPVRLQQLRALMQRLHASGTVIFVTVSSDAQNTPELNALMKTFFRDTPYEVLVLTGLAGEVLRARPDFAALTSAPR